MAKKGKEGHSQSEETRDKISRGLMGQQHMLGRKHSKESKKKTAETLKSFSVEKKNEISKKKSKSLKALNLKGQNHYFYGKHHSKETKQKMSNAGKGRIFSQEHRLKLSEWQKGKTLSAEHRSNLSRAQKERWLNRKTVSQRKEI